MTPDEAYRARRATADDVDEVTRLLHAAARSLVAQGWRNWDPPYARDRVAADVETREVFLVVPASDEPTPGEPDVCGPTVATFTLGTVAARAYEPAPWPEPPRPALYLNRLAVDPAVQERGLGAWCLRAVERIARARGVRAVRCDVIAANVRLRALYERHGYVPCGERTHSGWTFASYERDLPDADETT